MESTLSNPGSIGGGGILRDQYGTMVSAFSIPLGFGTNNQAVIQATVYGIQWCINHGYTQVLLEVDSQLHMNWIRSNNKVSWSLYQFISDLREYIENLRSFHYSHI